MNSRLTFAAALGALLLPLPVLAQEEEPDPAVFATYFYCNEAREARADTIISESVAPIMDRHMAAGHLTAWGWYAHNTGGRWRRLRRRHTGGPAGGREELAGGRDGADGNAEDAGKVIL